MPAFPTYASHTHAHRAAAQDSFDDDDMMEGGGEHIDGLVKYFEKEAFAAATPARTVSDVPLPRRLASSLRPAPGAPLLRRDRALDATALEGDEEEEDMHGVNTNLAAAFEDADMVGARTSTNTADAQGGDEWIANTVYTGESAAAAEAAARAELAAADADADVMPPPAPSTSTYGKYRDARVAEEVEAARAAYARYQTARAERLAAERAATRQARADAIAAAGAADAAARAARLPEDVVERVRETERRWAAATPTERARLRRQLNAGNYFLQGGATSRSTLPQRRRQGASNALARFKSSSARVSASRMRDMQAAAASPFLNSVESREVEEEEEEEAAAAAADLWSNASPLRAALSEHDPEFRNFVDVLNGTLSQIDEEDDGVNVFEVSDNEEEVDAELQQHMDGLHIGKVGQRAAAGAVGGCAFTCPSIAEQIADAFAPDAKFLIDTRASAEGEEGCTIM